MQKTPLIFLKNSGLSKIKSRTMLVHFMGIGLEPLPLTTDAFSILYSFSIALYY